MTDEQARRIDSLLEQYGRIQRDLGQLEEADEAHEKALNAAAAQFAGILSTVERSCSDSTARLERKIDDQTARFDRKFREMHEERQARRLTLSMKVAIGCTILSIVGSQLAILLGAGAG